MARIISYIIISTFGLYSTVLFGIPVTISSDSGKYSSTKTQQLQINGKVIDKVTGETIPFCNIGNASSSWGTSSNELGEFVIQLDSLPAKLIFSHINYNKYVAKITQTGNIVVELTLSLIHI